ncbi:protein of unknown function [Pseudodesulfovibrio piezophilus C1TLV30]|uniref:Uncharacterized protein n=1 Tax=Pseudodesulfovibrio piezophilus (strain DSM 21447 / JCM 15486 / C1TLV30) TaxID=1322246 RepID=M1WJL7_PSEP2|nr:protein of unknown function [Pseudodesulfovibrio piezophilus C1TLV30]
MMASLNEKKEKQFSQAYGMKQESVNTGAENLNKGQANAPRTKQKCDQSVASTPLKIRLPGISRLKSATGNDKSLTPCFLAQIPNHGLRKDYHALDEATMRTPPGQRHFHLIHCSKA